MVTDKNNLVEVNSVQNEGDIIQTTDLAEGSSMDIGKLREDCKIEENVDNVPSTKTTSIEQDLRERSIEGEDKKSKTCPSSVGMETDPETIKPCKDIEDKKDKEEEMLCDGAKDVCLSNETACADNQKTEEATESGEAAKDKLGSSSVTALTEETNSAKAGLDAGGNLGENSSMASEGSQETIELSEKMKDATSTEDETLNKNLESCFAKKIEDTCFRKVDNLETLKEESENQNEILENITIADSSLCTTGKVDENPKPKDNVSSTEPEESITREIKDLAPTEALTMECKREGVMAVAGEDNIIAEEQDQTKTSKLEEHSQHSFMQSSEPTMENLENPLGVASEDIETTAPNEYAETITTIKEQRPVGSPEEILGETRKDESMISDDISNKENPEEKNLSAIDLDEKIRSAEVEIPNKIGNDMYVTHPPAEETVQMGGEKHDEVSISELGDLVPEAFEVPKEEEKHVNETDEARKSPESTILEYTSTKGTVKVDKLEKGREMNSEEELKEIDIANNKQEEIEQKEKAADKEFQIATKSEDYEKCKIEEGVPVMNSTHLCTGAEADHHGQEHKSRPNSSEEATSESNIGDQSCRTSNEIKNVNDQIINEEAIQEYKDQKIAARGEETEKEMKNEECIITDHSPESNCKDTTKCSQANEAEAKKCKAEMGEELETTSEAEGIEKQVLAEENRVQDWSRMSAGEELEAESSKEDATMIKMPKEEVLEVLQTAEGSANVGKQTKEEDSIKKDKFAACAGEDTKNERCYDEKKVEKEPDTVVLNSNTESIEHTLDATHSVEEREVKDEADPNKGWNAQSIAGSSEEEIVTNESVLDIAENSSGSEISKMEILEKVRSRVTEVAKETSLIAAEEEYTMKIDSSDLVSEEKGEGKGLVTTGISENVSNGREIIAQPEKASNLGENKDMEISITRKHEADEAAAKKESGNKNETRDTLSKTEDQREIATAETSLDEISKQNLQAPSTLSLEERNLTTAKVSEKQTIEEESEIIKEQTIEEESCTKELHIMSVADETVNKVTDLDLAPIQSFEATASNNSTDMVKSKVAEDLNQESEASPETKALKEEIKETIEKHVDVSSSVSEVSEEKFYKENIGDTGNCDDHTDIAPTVVAEATALGEFKLSDKPVKDFDASSDTKTPETTKTAETSQQDSEVDSMKLEETSTVLSQLPIHEHEKADNDSITVAKADANDVEVEQNKIPDVVSESKDQSVEEIHEIGTSLNVGDTNTNEIEKQIREVTEALLEPINQGDEAANDDEIIAPTVVTEETSFGEVQLIDKPVKARDTGSEAKSLETTKTADTNQQEVDSRKLEETSSMVHEHEKADNESITEESCAIDIEGDENKIPDTVSESKDQGVEDSHETSTSLTVGETDTNKIEKQIRVVPEELSEPIYQGVETASNNEIAPGQTLQDEKIEEQLQVSSSTLLSNEEDSETITIVEKTENGSAKKDDTEVDKLKLEEVSSMVTQLQYENANNITVEKSDADEVQVEETKTLDAESDPNDQDFEEIYGTKAGPTAETTDTDKMKEVKEVTEKICNPICQGVEAVADDHTPDQRLSVAKLEEQLHAFETRTTIEKIEDHSTKKVETEVDKIKFEESTCMLSQFPKIEHDDADDVSAFIEKSDAGHFEIEEAQTSKSISESKVHVEEIHDIMPSPTVEKIHTDKVKEEIKAVPETIFEPNNQGVEAIIDGDITPNQTLPTERKEQLQEPSSALLKENDQESITRVEMIKDESTEKDETQWTENVVDSFETGATEKPCLQDEGPRELEVSNLDPTVVTVQDTQNQTPEEEIQEYIPNIKYADSPTEHEKTSVRCSSQATSNDEDIMDSGNSNKDSDNLPPPYSKTKELLPGEVDEKCEQASNLEFEKTGKVLKFVSEIHNPELPPISEEAEIKKEQLNGVITESRDRENHIEETVEANEAIKKDTSKEEITEEDQVVRNSHSVSPHEGTVTKSNQEDELQAADHSGEGANETFDSTKKEIQHEELYEEFEKAGADKNIKETTTTEDKTVEDPYQVSVGDGIANISLPDEAKDGKNLETAPIKLELENQADETNFRDTATEPTAPIKEAKISEIMLVKYENKGDDSDKEIMMSKDGQLQNTDLAVPTVTDAAAEEGQDGKVGENFEEVTEGPTRGAIGTYEEKNEIASADTNNLEILIENENQEHKSPEQACKGNGVTEGLNQKEKEVCANKPSLSSCAAISQEEILGKESENTVDEKQNDFMSDKQTKEAVSIIEEGKSIQCEKGHTEDEVCITSPATIKSINRAPKTEFDISSLLQEPVESSTMGNERKLDEAKIYSTITANEGEETHHQNEKSNVLSHVNDTEVSHEKGIMNLAEVNEITNFTQELEKTSLLISNEQIAGKTYPVESTETTNSTASKDVPVMQEDPTAKTFQNAEVKDLKAGYASGSELEAKGVDHAEEKKMGEECQETMEKSIPIDSTTISSSDLLHRSTKETVQVVENLIEEREFIGNKEEPQTETAKTAQVAEAKIDEEKDEKAEGDEQKRADLGYDAPVMVEASRDMDVKIAHKKSHNILSGVGSKVKHSIAKVKKVITGKSSHPKTPSKIGQENS